MNKVHSMKTDDVFSLSYETDQNKISSYFTETAIFLFVSVATISSAEARRLSPVEVVVYAGKPIDYSNRSDVIFIDETDNQNRYSNVILIEDSTNNISSQPQAIAKNTTPPAYQSQPRVVSKVSTTQPKAKPVTVNKLVPIRQIALKKLNEKIVPNTEIVNVKVKDPELAAFYDNVLVMQKLEKSKQSASIKTPAAKQVSTKIIVQRKSGPKLKSNEVQLALKTTKGKIPDLMLKTVLPNKGLLTNVKGKDPQLVAFYMDVFAKQNKYLSNQSIPSKSQIVKQTSVKNVAQQKSKPKLKRNEVQLSLTTSKGKDPELVAFYEQVFAIEKSNTSKQTLAVATAKEKDPELVAFYEREFGKSTSSTKVQISTKKSSSKTKFTASAKSKQKRNVKKVVNIVKEKNINSRSTELAEIKKLIDGLTDKKII